jgi:phosphoenolpyruvate carboxylase
VFGFPCVNPMPKQRALRQDVETLNGLLEEVLVEQTTAEFAVLLKQIRQLAQERRVGLP